MWVRQGPLEFSEPACPLEKSPEDLPPFAALHHLALLLLLLQKALFACRDEYHLAHDRVGDDEIVRGNRPASWFNLLHVQVGTGGLVDWRSIHLQVHKIKGNN